MVFDQTQVLAVAVVMLALIGVYRLVRARQFRIVDVLSRDQTLLSSTTLGLSGRPDRLVRLRNDMVIPYEKKSSKRLHDSHRIQVGAYLLLVEEAYGKRPAYGVLALGDDRSIKIKNTARLRRWTLRVAKEIRAQRADLSRKPRMRPSPNQCRSCSFRDGCEDRAS